MYVNGQSECCRFRENPRLSFERSNWESLRQPFCGQSCPCNAPGADKIWSGTWIDQECCRNSIDGYFVYPLDAIFARSCVLCHIGVEFTIEEAWRPLPSSAFLTPTYTHIYTLVINNRIN